MKENDRDYEIAVHHFTEEERGKLGDALQDATLELEDLRGKKLVAMKDFGKVIAEKEQEVRQLARMRRLGYRSDKVEVIYDMNRPSKGWKVPIRVDTNERLPEVRMEPEDQQDSFYFPDPELSHDSDDDDEDTDGKSRGAGE